MPRKGWGPGPGSHNSDQRHGQGERAKFGGDCFTKAGGGAWHGDEEDYCGRRGRSIWKESLQLKPDG